MNTLQKFHCECGAPLKAKDGIIECAYCGNCYIWDGQVELEIRQADYNELEEYYNDCDYFYNEERLYFFGEHYAPTLMETWNGVEVADYLIDRNSEEKDTCTCYRFRSGYCLIHGRYGYNTSETVSKTVKYSIWDNIVISFTNVFDGIRNAIIKFYKWIGL